jgi:hypothetical protein
MPIKNVADVRSIVDATNIVFRLGSILTGNVGVPQLVVGIYTANSKEIQIANTAERRRQGNIFLISISKTTYQVLSAVTTIVADVAWSELTDRAVVVISKSN